MKALKQIIFARCLDENNFLSQKKQNTTKEKIGKLNCIKIKMAKSHKAI
jgi:hypothetical protein